MTEYIKQWIKDQAVKGLDAFSSSQVKMIGYSMGLEKGIEIAEGGFTKWTAWNYLPNTQFDDIWFDKKDGTPFTTSQLLEKYLSHLLNKEND